MKYFIAILSFLFFQLSTTYGATCTWNGSNGIWDDPLNWDCGEIPDSDDDVFINSGIVTLTTPTTIQSITLSNGELTGNVDLVVSGAVTWNGGTISGTGNITSEGLASLGSGTKYLSEKTMIFNAGANWSSGNITFSNNAQITNSSGQTFSISLNSNSYDITDGGGGGTFDNQGIVDKTAASSSTNDIEIVFNNTGTVNINGGTLKLTGGGTWTGSSASIAAGTTLDFSGGTHEITTSSATGSGTFKQSNGIVNINSGNTINCPFHLQFGNFNDYMGLTFSSYTQVNGQFLCNFNTIVSGTMNWSGGSIVGGTSFYVNGLATLSSSTKTLDKKNLILNGGASWSSGDINLVNNPTIQNSTGQVFSISLISNSYDIVDLGGGAIFENQGTLEKTLASTSTNDLPVTFNNTGSVNVNGGVLKLNDGGSWTNGNASIGSGATLEYAGGLHVVNNSTYSGSGTCKLSNGALSIISGAINCPFTLQYGNLNDNVGLNFPSLTFINGVYNCMSNTIVSGDFTWSGGEIQGSGSLTVNGNATLSSDTKTLDQKTLIFDGGANWTGGSINLDNNPTIRNGVGQVFSINLISNSYDIVDLGGGGTFDNQGTLEKTVTSTSTNDIPVTFNNTGTVNINGGTLNLNGSGTWTGATANIANGTTLELAGTNHTMISSSISGDGTLKQSNGAVNINLGSSLTCSLTLQFGTFYDNVGLTIPFYTQNNGTYNSGKDATISGDMTWNGGTIIGAGTLSVDGVGQLGSSTKILDQKILELNGGATWSSGSLNFNNNAIIRNTSGQTFSITTNSTSYDMVDVSGGTFENHGILSKSELPETEIEVALQNSGTIKGIGTLKVSGTFTNTGTLAPGLSPGNLIFNSNFAMGNTTEIELKDYSGAGTGHDIITLSAAASLGGVLDISFLDGFEPVVGDEFTIMTCSTCSGSFSSISHPGNNPSAWEVDLSTPGEVTLKLIAPLPVELIDFRAVKKDGYIRLNWNTASETNNHFFQVEHSMNGIQFAQIGAVQGAGTSAEINQYDFKFVSPPPGNNYFRLKQVDYDGQFEYSEVINIKVWEDTQKVKIFPNPASDYLIVQPEKIIEGATIRVFDIYGKLVFEKTDFSERLKINIAELEDGFYTVEWNSGQIKEVQKFIKIKRK